MNKVNFYRHKPNPDKANYSHDCQIIPGICDHNIYASCYINFILSSYSYILIELSLLFERAD